MSIQKKFVVELVAEFFATFLLAFFLFTLGFTVQGLIAFVLGAIFMVLIYVFSPLTRTHMNPAVTFAFYVVTLIRQLVNKAFKIADLYKMFAFVATQFLAFLAAHPIAYWFRDQFIVFMSNGQVLDESTKATYLQQLDFANVLKASETAWFIFFIEAFITFLFIFVILRITTNETYKQYSGLVIGMVVFAIVYFAFQISGAVFNPFKSIVGTMFSVNADAGKYLWIYVSAPFLGALLAALAHSGLQFLRNFANTPSTKKVEKVESKEKSKNKKKK